MDKCEAERLAELLMAFSRKGHTPNERPWRELVDNSATLLRAQSARIAALEEALRGVLFAGNHLALLIGADHPPYEAEPPVALAHYGAGDQYEIWCCWRAIMQTRLALGKGSE